MTVRITVPTTPEGLHPSACWRRTIASLDTRQAGAYQVAGEHLHAGDEVDLPAGTLVLAVDKRTLRWEVGYRTRERYPVEDATVTVLLAGTDGLKEVWTRHYKTAKGAFGSTTMRKLTALLDAHPAPVGAVTVVAEAQRPNSKAGTCRWCSRSVAAGLGHLVGHGDQVQVECWQHCRRYITVPAGQECGLCGVPVIPGEAEWVMVREGEGRWEVRHWERLDCTTTPAKSHQEHQEEMAAHRAEVAAAERAEAEKQRKQREAAERRKAKKAAAEREAHDAEQARVSALTETGRTATTLYDKSLGGTMRARMDEVTVRLSDGTTTLRWTITTYSTSNGATGYGDYDPMPSETTEYTRKEQARSAYQGRQWSPPPTGRHQGGGVCDNCGRRGARHRRHDSSGIPGVVCNACDEDEDYMLSFA